MTIAKPKMISLPMPGAVIEAVRAFFAAPDDYERLVAKPKPQPMPQQNDAFHQDRSRYARLLEKELDRQLLTEVEQEDTDMLNRVRSALYAD